MLTRGLLWLALLGSLAGCSLYNSIFHPYRLPTPDAPPEFKKQQKAKELKARDSAKAAKKARSEAMTDADAAPVEAAAPPTADDPQAATEGDAAKKPPKKKAHYNGEGLLNKPKLIRRRYHKPEGKGFHPLEGIKNFFKYTIHGKPKQKPSGKGKKDRQPDAPADSFPPPSGQ